MSLMVEMEKMLQSKLYKLRYSGKIVAMRAVLYNTESRVYEYYDFYTDKIKSKDIRKFLTDNSSNFEILDLFEFKDKLITNIEANNKILVKEVEEIQDVESMLSRFKMIYSILENMEGA